jgi:hypothetical protein
MQYEAIVLTAACKGLRLRFGGKVANPEAPFHVREIIQCSLLDRGRQSRFSNHALRAIIRIALAPDLALRFRVVGVGFDGTLHSGTDRDWVHFLAERLSAPTGEIERKLA